MDFFELLFWVFVVFLLPSMVVSDLKKKNKKKFKKIEVEPPAILVKTKQGIRIIDSLSRREGKLFSFLADLGIVLGFGVFGSEYLFREAGFDGKKKLFANALVFSLGFLVYYLLQGLVLTPAVLAGAFGGFGFFGMALLSSEAFDVLAKLFVGTHTVPRVSPVLPGVRIPGALFIPWYGIFSLIFIVVVHEFSHGVLARKARVKIKSTGALFFGLIPLGAFVEPDERELKTKTRREKLRVFSVASSVNLCCAVLFMLFGVLLMPWYNQNVYLPAVEGVQIVCVSNCSTSGLKGGLVLEEFQGKKVDNLFSFYETYSNLSFGDNVSIIANNTSFVAEYREDIGLGLVLEPVLKKNIFFNELGFAAMDLVFLTGFLSFAIGLFNFLPVLALDGGRMFNELAEYYLKLFGVKKAKKRAKRSVLFFTLFALLLIFVNALPYFVNHPAACVCLP